MSNIYSFDTGTHINTQLNEFNQIDFEKISYPTGHIDMSAISITNTTSVPSLTTITTTGTGSIPGTTAGGYITTNDLLGSSWLDSQEIEKIIDKKLAPVLNRLAILEEPDPRVLTKYESLRTAYEHYRTLEALMMAEIEEIKRKK